MALRSAEGLVFGRLDVRGKVVIGYLPIASVWNHLVATGCLVAGRSSACGGVAALNPDASTSPFDTLGIIWNG